MTNLNELTLERGQKGVPPVNTKQTVIAVHRWTRCVSGAHVSGRAKQTYSAIFTDFATNEIGEDEFNRLSNLLGTFYKGSIQTGGGSHSCFGWDLHQTVEALRKK